MNEPFATILTAGGHANSLGRTNEVIDLVLQNQSRLPELYDCLHHQDAWVRMRAADAIEKICRQHPIWLVPYIDTLHKTVAASGQASLQWHLAQIYREVELTHGQRATAIAWLKHLISTTNVDWIVSADAMKTLVQFVKQGHCSAGEVVPMLKLQQTHASATVQKKARTLLSATL